MIFAYDVLEAYFYGFKGFLDVVSYFNVMFIRFFALIAAN
jgi:hypothetical protein